MVLEVGTLDKKMLNIHLAVSGVSFSSTLFTSRPVTTAFSKRPFQGFLFILALLVLLISAAQWMEAVESRTRVAVLWKFSVLQLRHTMLTGPDHCRSDDSTTLTIKHGGYALPSKTWHSGDGDVIVELTAGVPVADEWCFRTDAESGSTDPVRFALHTSDDGATWSQVASSSSYMEMTGGLGFYDGLFNTPDIRDADVCFPMSPQFGWMCLQATTMSAQFVFMVFVLWLAVQGNEDRARKIYAASLSIVATNLVLQGYGAWGAAGWQRSQKFVLAAIVPYIWSYTIFFREHHFILGTMTSSLVDFSINVARYDGDVLHIVWLALIHSAILGLGCWVLLYKRRAMADAAKLIEQDKVSYDAEWSDVSQGQLSGLTHLQTLVQTKSPCADQPVQQLNFDGTKKQSLDQLYMEASQANEILKRKVVEWGKVSNGFLPANSCMPVMGSPVMRATMDENDTGGSRMEGGGREAERRKSCTEIANLVSCAELDGSREDDLEVKWASIKASSRAIEKVYRSYWGEVSELSDLCRQTLVFKTADDVAACLGSMLSDPHVRVVRVKNRFDLDFDSAESAGFRNVAVSVELRGHRAGVWKGGGGGEGAGAGGVWQHICEVQLHLETFYALSSIEGHKRYVQFRNLSGV